jgi:hypothetical protein
MNKFTYEFSLIGEHESLTRAMAQFDQSQDVVFFHDDTDVPSYYFSSMHLEGLTDLGQVWDRASQLLKLYNAAHELTETTQSSPRLHHPNLALEKLYINNNTLPNYKPGAMPRYQIEPFDGEIPVNKSVNTTLYGELLSLARTEPEAFEVLELFSQVHYMPDYYKVFESARTAMGKSAFDQMLGTEGLMADYIRFKSTTNNLDVGKQNARHGRPGSTMPPAMTPEEAKTLAMKIGRRFFTAKYGFRFPPEASAALATTDVLVDDDF